MKLPIIFAALIAGVANAASGPANYQKRSDEWFAGPEARQVAANILSYQATTGGWPKNIDTTTPSSKHGLSATFDNGATIGEMRFLARIHRATGEASYAAAFNRGLDHILVAQYPTGGWPQSYPPDHAYHRYITFNDNAMVNLMNFLQEISTDDSYAFVRMEKRVEAKEAFDRGVRCILKCQVKVDGKLTAWCAQHDELDCRPRPARAFELVSLSGSESVGIVRLLMGIEHPNDETIAAVDGAVAWLERVKITGHKLATVVSPDSPGGKDKLWVEDADAPPLWARFYEIGSNRPFFCDRDGVVKYAISEIGHERRNGYSWVGDWPRKLLEKEYPEWKKSHR